MVGRVVRFALENKGIRPDHTYALGDPPSSQLGSHPVHPQSQILFGPDLTIGCLIVCKTRIRGAPHRGPDIQPAGRQVLLQPPVAFLVPILHGRGGLGVMEWSRRLQCSSCRTCHVTGQEADLPIPLEMLGRLTQLRLTLLRTPGCGYVKCDRLRYLRQPGSQGRAGQLLFSPR